MLNLPKRIGPFFLLTLVWWSCTNRPTPTTPIQKPYHDDTYVETLLKKMTLEEKIGQLNLLTPGGAVTGSVVSQDVEAKIKAGLVGGIFGIRGADKTRQAQEIAVKQSRLGIPLIIGMDVIHGHQTMMPIPLGLSCTWDMDLIEQWQYVFRHDCRERWYPRDR